MVLIKRKQSSFLTSGPSSSSSSFQPDTLLPLHHPQDGLMNGNAAWSSLFRWFPHSSSSSSPSGYKSSFGRRSSSGRMRISDRQLLPWYWQSVIQGVYAAALLSWIVAWRVQSYTMDSLEQLQHELRNVNLHQEHTMESLFRLRDLYRNEQITVQQLKDSQQALQHEVRILHELSDAAAGDMTMMMTTTTTTSHQDPRQAQMPGGKNARVQTWLDYRLEQLHHKTHFLQAYQQQLSRSIVKEQYGKGPYRVRITVDLSHDERQESGLPRHYLRSFVVEMAPLELMPHAVHFFLYMVEHHTWDHTVFLHHEKMDHLVPGAPVDYYSGELKHDHLVSIGWAALAFPEYHPDYPHRAYTIGFSGAGPSFYINTMDNDEAHGPNGQGHHFLPGDADPCFGRVVEGREVVDELVRATSKPSEYDQIREEFHTWTHIVSMDLE